MMHILNDVCVYKSDISRYFECDLLTCANPRLSFDECSTEDHRLVAASKNWNTITEVPTSDDVKV